MGDIVTIQNRTNLVVEFTHDGRPYVIPAGEAVAMSRTAGEHGVMKSCFDINPWSETAKFKLGIVGETDCTPLDDDGSDRKELLDRASMTEAGEGVDYVAFNNPEAGIKPRKSLHDPT